MWRTLLVVDVAEMLGGESDCERVFGKVQPPGMEMPWNPGFDKLQRTKQTQTKPNQGHGWRTDIVGVGKVAVSPEGEDTHTESRQRQSPAAAARLQELGALALFRRDHL